MLLKFSAIAAALVASVSAHMTMTDPCPRFNPWCVNKPTTLPAGASWDYNIKNPIDPSSPVLCKSNTPWPSPVATWTAGQSVTVQFLQNNAAHGGGHAQFSVSYDGGKTFAVVYEVLKYFFFNGPSTSNSPEVLQYTFTLPKELPNSDSVVFAWSWVNAIGNREFYMNCADVAITGSSSSSYTGKKMVIADHDNYPTIPAFNGNYDTGLNYYEDAPMVTVSPSGSSSGGNGTYSATPVAAETTTPAVYEATTSSAVYETTSVAPVAHMVQSESSPVGEEAPVSSAPAAPEPTTDDSAPEPTTDAPAVESTTDGGSAPESTTDEGSSASCTHGTLACTSDGAGYQACVWGTCQPTEASSLPHLSTRDVTSDLKTIKRGILAKNGKITSCELGIFTNLAALVSADCLDYTNGLNLNSSTSYDAYVDDGIDGKAGKYEVYGITVHPKYDSSTKANNIAVIQFNKGQDIIWNNTIAIKRELYWGDMVYSRSAITDLDSMTWKDPEVSKNPPAEDPNCDSMSVLYNTNSYDFTCSASTVPSPDSYLSPCDIPYGTVYTYMNDTLYLAGFYSYSSVSGKAGDDGLCNSGTVRNYYVMMSDWIIFAATNIDPHMFYYHPHTDEIAPELDISYTLKTPGTSDKSTVSLVGGDYFKYQGTFTSSSSLSSESASDSNMSSKDLLQSSFDSDDEGSFSEDDASSLEFNNESNTESLSEDATGSSPSEKDDDNDKSNHKTIIIAVVVAFVGGVILVAGLFYLFRQWNKNRKLSIEDPVSRATMAHMDEVAVDNSPYYGRIQSQAGANMMGVPHSEQPPVYDDDVPLTNSGDKRKSIFKKQ
ncbi:hypothetical protein EV178_004568 [Coemansia sp. RSA 1646]|nr:hypothetical protein EV178_004568 [Coemansia sp. RSA 1646]